MTLTTFSALHACNNHHYVTPLASGSHDHTFCTSTLIKFVTTPAEKRRSSLERIDSVLSSTATMRADRTRSCTRLARKPNWVDSRALAMPHPTSDEAHPMPAAMQTTRYGTDAVHAQGHAPGGHW